MKITAHTVAGFLLGVATFGLIQGTFYHFKGGWDNEWMLFIPLVIGFLIFLFE